MPKIKLSSTGKVFTQDGKPSCSCCGCYVDCAGLWGPGYDLFPTLVNAVNHSGEETISNEPFLPRWTRCYYSNYSTSTGGALPTSIIEVFYWSSFCKWAAHGRASDANYYGGDDGDIDYASGDNGEAYGYKPGGFSSGPIGNYYSNTDGTGLLMFTVT